MTDPSGAAVEGARVTLRTDPERHTRTGGDGWFEFPNAALGSHPATVEAAGFAAWRGALRPGAPAEIRLELAPAVESITVNAGTLDEERLDDPLPASGIGRMDIASRNNRRLSDVVARLPGVFLTGPPGGEKDVRVRGLDKEFSRTQVDGVAIPDGGEKRELQLNRIPSSVVETVRIVRNPTAEFESDGLAGRVEVRTRPVPDEFHLDARAGYGARAAARNRLAQGQLTAGARPGRRWGFLAGYNLLDDHLPIGRRKLLASRTAELEDERQHQRSGNFFGNLGVEAGRLGGFHWKPVVMGFETGMDKLKTSVNPSGTLLSRSTETEAKSQRTRGISLNHQLARPWGLVWDTQVAYYRSAEEKDKLTQNYKVAAGAYTPDKRTPEIETKADRTWNFATSAALPLRWGVWHQLKVGHAFRLRDRFRDKSKFEIDPAGNRKDATTDKDRYALSEDYHAWFAQDRMRLTERLSLLPGVRVERVVLNARSRSVAAAPRVFSGRETRRRTFSIASAGT